MNNQEAATVIDEAASHLVSSGYDEAASSLISFGNGIGKHSNG
jgi:hypothetical protein